MKCLIEHLVPQLVLVFCSLHSFSADGFVEEVSCGADSLTVVLNQSDPDLARWMTDPKAAPVAYVHGHKGRIPCGTSIKTAEGNNFKLNIPYGKQCDVILADLEPNFLAAETTIALEDNSDNSIAKNFRINHVYCLYTKSVKTIKFSDVSVGQKIVASTGGKPKPKVEMLFRSTDGNPLRAAKLGDIVEFYVALTPDQAYRGITPKDCMFADREDATSPDARHISFVQNSCPVEDMSELIDPLQNVNQEVYFSKFHTFRFGNQSTVFAHCTVQVCLTAEECSQSCFKRVRNSNLTAERLRRHRREVLGPQDYSKKDVYDEIALSNTLTILDESQARQVSARAVESCLLSPASTPSSLLAIISALSILTVVSVAAAVYLLLKNRKYSKDSFDVYGAFGSGSVTSNMSHAVSMGGLNQAYQPSYGQRTHPYVHHLRDGEGTYR